jgi:hypothetical protein
VCVLNHEWTRMDTNEVVVGRGGMGWRCNEPRMDTNGHE